MLTACEVTSRQIELFGYVICILRSKTASNSRPVALKGFPDITTCITMRNDLLTGCEVTSRQIDLLGCVMCIYRW